MSTSRPTTPQSPTLQEQLQERRKQFRLKEPKIVESERRESARQKAIRQLKESGEYGRLHGGRKSRKHRGGIRRVPSAEFNMILASVPPEISWEMTQAKESMKQYGVNDKRLGIEANPDKMLENTLKSVPVKSEKAKQILRDAYTEGYKSTTTEEGADYYQNMGGRKSRKTRRRLTRRRR